ncbi:MAG TPA: hypothetical protein DCE18_09000 [Syntrophobacteraceae bacterium]|nr:hypothetical protein [Syntrophobacteraceae bacterium]
MSPNIIESPSQSPQRLMPHAVSSVLQGALMHGNGPQSFGLRDILRILFKHKYKILMVFLLANIAAPLIYKIIPKVYEAEAFLMVKFGREYLYSAELSPQGQTSSPFARNEVMNSEIQILSSRDLKERVIATLGAQKLYPQVAKATSATLAQKLALIAFDKSFEVTPVKSSSVIKASLKGQNPEVITQALNQLIYFYEEKRREVYKDPKSILFLEKQSAEYRQRLKKSEDELEVYKQQNQVYSLYEQRSALLQQRSALDTSLMANENQVKELRQKLASLEEQIKTIKETSTVSTDAAGLDSGSGESQLLSLRLKEQELLGKYTEENRLVQDLRKQIKVLEDHVAASKRTGSGGVRATKGEVYQEVQKDIIKTKAELSALEVTAVSLKKQVESLDKDVQSLDLLDKRLRELTRTVANDERNYQTVLQKLEEAQVFDEMDRQKMSSVSIVEPARVPLEPVSPKKGLPVFLAVGALLGLGAGLGLAYLLETMGQTIATPEEAERHLALPVLVTIPFKSELGKG